MKKLILGIAVVGACGLFAAEEIAKGNGSAAKRPEGFHFLNGRLTVKPYVALSYTYDSNIDTTRHSDNDSIFCINPGADFTWTGDRWKLTGGVWYRYNAYCEYTDTLAESSYGENLNYEWNNIRETDKKGWRLMATERYAYISQNDDINDRNGRGIWRDRERLDVTGALERQFSERLHGLIYGQYNWLDYKNDTGRYAPLYGWSQRAVGLEAGWAFGAYSDLLIAGGYNDYTQHKGRGYYNYSTDSHVWSVQGGVGSRATKKITYRALMGASQISYGGHNNADSGWTYELSANWRLDRQWQISVLGNSYYQPSERSLGQAIKVYALSGGVSYLTPGDQLKLNANISYRLEDTVWNDRYLAAGNDYDETILSIRLGADYTINRWMSVYANFTWEENWCDDYGRYDYDRFRFTVGMRFHY